MAIFYTAKPHIFSKGVKTIQAGMNNALDQDVICINQKQIQNDKTIVLKPGVTITGDSKKARPTIMAKARTALFFVPAKFTGKVIIRHVNIELGDQSVALRVNSPNCQVILEDVHVYHANDTVAPYNALVFDGQGNGQLQLQNTLIDSIQANVNMINLEQSNIGDWFLSENSVLIMNQGSFSESALQNVLLEGNNQNTTQLQLRSCKLGGNVRFNQLTVNAMQLQLARLPSITHVARKASVDADATSLIVGLNTQMKVNHFSQLNPDNQKLNSKWKLPHWRALGVVGGSLTLTDGYLINGDLKNVAKAGDITLENVTDDSSWSIGKNIQLSNRNSQSDLFKAQSKLNVSAMKADTSTQNSKTALQKLNDMIGLSKVKSQVHQIISQAQANAERKRRGLTNSEDKSGLDMVFAGSPGTGKTVVARLVGQALYEAGVLKSTKFIEARQADLVGKHVGETSPKTKAVIQKSLDGVLFIDEAYQLAPPKGGGNTFNDEAVTELVAGMENYANRLVVIMAGYTQDMSDFFKRGNSGLRSRMHDWVEFPDYSPQELKQIAVLDLEKSHARLANKETMIAISKGIDKLLPVVSRGHDTGNGRFIRNYIQKLTEIRDARITNSGNISKLTNDQLMIIEPQDVSKAVQIMQEQAVNMQQ